MINYEYYHRANNCIAQGALTNSKRLSAFIKGVSPTHAKKGSGAFIYDQDNRKYLDFICGLGSQLFGYSNQFIVSAIREELDRGITLSLSSTLEVEAAERMKEILPFVGKGRFLKTGTEACMAAVRIACAHTGRTKVLSEGYHGWSDGFISLLDGAGCQPHNWWTFTGLDQIGEDISCVIVEPIITDASEKRIQFLKDIQAKCKETKTILIFDEVITGLRFPTLSVSTYTGILPDIICLGKSIGGGLPLSYVGLKPGIGENAEWFVSSTFAGEMLSLRAFMKITEILKNEYKIQDLWDKGIAFRDEFNTLLPERITIEGYGTRGVFKGDEKTFALFMQGCHKAGVLIGPSFFLSFANIDYREIAMSTFRDIILRIKNDEVKLEGEMPKKPLSM